MRFFCLALLLPLLGSAAILPEAIGPYTRCAISLPVITDQAVWTEYGLKNSESAVYEQGKSKFTATVWQMQDSTAALAAYDWQRPEKAVASDAAKLAVQTADSLFLAHGNYVFSFAGYKPSKEEFDAIRRTLVNIDS